MKFRRPTSHRFASGLVVLLLGFLLNAGSVSGYDSPDFVTRVFSGDGIYLPDDQKTSLLEALAAIASNFPNNQKVDDDLKEKAIALALRIDPLHYHSRLAQRALAKGEMPKPTSFFDSLSSISETLWTIATRFSTPPLEPEQYILAHYLMEMSLLTHPEPPSARLEVFATDTDPRDLQWDKFVKLAPKPNGSTALAKFLLKEGSELVRENRQKNPAKEDRTKERLTAADPLPSPDRTRPVEFTPVIRSLAAVREVKIMDESKPVIGTVSLTIRNPARNAERQWLNEQMALTPFPLIPSQQSTPVDSISIPGGLSVAAAWSWPPDTLGEVSFVPLTSAPGPRRLISTEVFLPTIVLIEGALKNLTVNEEFLLAGTLNPTTLAPSLTGSVFETLTVARKNGQKYLLVPATVEDELVELLLKSNQLDLLFSPELVSYTSPEGAIARILSPTDPSFTEASTVFAEIKAVTERMSLPDLARNLKVQERLESILATCPDHLSARVMLEFGKRPVTPEMRLKDLSGRIDTIVRPFLTLDDSDTNQAILKQKIEAAEVSFSRIRSDVPLEGREFLSAAEDLVDAVEMFLSLTNKSTSIAIQRRREANQAIAAYSTLRTVVGLAPLTEEGE